MAARKKKATRKKAGKTTKKATKKKAAKKATKKPAKKATKKKAAKKATTKATRKLPREGLSMRAYALRRLDAGLPGGTHVAVRKAIIDGRLTSASCEKRGRRWIIDPVLADREWEDATHAGKTRDPKKISAARKAAAARKTDLHDDARSFQPSLFGVGNQSAETAREEASLVSSEDKTSTAAVTRASAFYGAQLKRLEYLTKAGKLVEKDSVDAEIFSAFRSLRELVLGIPDRIGAILAAETDEATIRTLLRKELKENLEALANDLQRR